jgi:hypothetical protein
VIEPLVMVTQSARCRDSLTSSVGGLAEATPPGMTKNGLWPSLRRSGAARTRHRLQEEGKRHSCLEHTENQAHSETSPGVNARDADADGSGKVAQTQRSGNQQQSVHGPSLPSLLVYPPSNGRQGRLVSITLSLEVASSWALERHGQHRCR